MIRWPDAARFPQTVTANLDRFRATSAARAAMGRSNTCVLTPPSKKIPPST